MKVAWSGALALAVLMFAAVESGAGEAVSIKEGDGKLTITINEKHFSDYVYKGSSRPYLHPLLGPGGARLTRDWPIKEGTPNEEKDHPHHKSFWWEHGSMNGVDFWAEGKESGKTVHEKFVEEIGRAHV